MVTEFGTDMCTMLHLKWTDKKGLLDSRWSSAQCYVAAWMGGEFGEEWIHVYVWPSPCCPPETITTLLTEYTQYKIKSFKK